MAIPLYQVDAFTDRPFRGNPAAVCLPGSPQPEEWMRNVAAEMNLSETAFLYPGEGAYRLRWFTPVIEVDLCGHATLASAHILWEEGHAANSGEIRFQTRSGLLKAGRDGDWIELDFPSTPEHTAAAPPDLAGALGTELHYVGRSVFDYLVELPSEEAVRSLRPDFARLAKVDGRGVIVTARSESPPYDFVSRFFAPGAGVNEDPVTGSAHCCLGQYWGARLGKTELIGFQTSARGGVVRVALRNDRVRLAGQAVTVFRGEITP